MDRKIQIHLLVQNTHFSPQYYPSYSTSLTLQLREIKFHSKQNYKEFTSSKGISELPKYLKLQIFKTSHLFRIFFQWNLQMLRTLNRLFSLCCIGIRDGVWITQCLTLPLNQETSKVITQRFLNLE